MRGASQKYTAVIDHKQRVSLRVTDTAYRNFKNRRALWRSNEGFMKLTGESPVETLRWRVSENLNFISSTSDT